MALDKKISCGLLMCRWRDDNIEFFLIHPGGPFYKNKDKGAWTIPKGLPEENEDMLTAAKREFKEETGITPVAEEFTELQPIKQTGGKIVNCWTFLMDWDDSIPIESNHFIIEWPPKSRRFQSFPEADEGKFWPFEQAAELILPKQLPLLVEALSRYQQGKNKTHQPASFDQSKTDGKPVN